MNIKKTFLYILIGSVAISVAVGILVVLFGTSDQGTRVFLSSLTITIASFSMFLNGIFFERMIGKILPFLGFILTPICALLTIALTWGGIDYQPAGTALILLAANFFLLPIAIFHEKKGARAVPLLGLLGTLITVAFAIMTIWELARPSEIGEKIFSIASILALACFYISLISYAKLSEKFRWASDAVQGITWITFLIGAYSIITTPQNEEPTEFIQRLLTIMAILLSASTLLIPIFHFMSRGEFTSGSETIDRIDEEIAALKKKLEELEAKREKITGRDEA